MTETPTGYSRLIVILHWVTALLILYILTIGHETMEQMPNSAPAKVDVMRTHLILGGTVLALTMLRVAVKWLNPVPPAAATGNRWIDRAVTASHFTLYGLVLLIGISGVVLASQSGLFDAIFEGGALPPSFDAYVPRQVHEVLGKVLLVLVGLHVLAALYHQFIVRDDLFRRMWFAADPKL